jgi:hypothetical protein
MHILSACTMLIILRQYANSRTRFPNELLSLEQNKDAPDLNKELVIWILSQFPRT